MEAGRCGRVLEETRELAADSNSSKSKSNDDDRLEIVHKKTVAKEDGLIDILIKMPRILVI